jgi:HlyD family secretion protein
MHGGVHALPIREPIVPPGAAQQNRVVDSSSSGSVRRTWLAILAVVVVLVAIASLMYLIRILGSVDRSRLKIATVERGTFVRDFTASGQVVASGSVTLYAPAAGSITLSVRAGDAVDKGQVLAIIDSPDLKVRLAQEEATLDSLRIDWQRSQLQAARRLSQLHEALSQADVDQKTARRELERSRKAFELGSYSELQALRAQDALEKAEFADSQAKVNYNSQARENRFDIDSKKAIFDREQYLVRELQRQVGSLQIKSAVDGKVGQVHVANSAAIAKDTPLLAVADLSAFEIEAKVPESIARDLVLGMAVDIEDSGRSWKGSVSGISPEIAGAGVAVRVRFGDSKPDGLHQGDRLLVRILIDRRSNVLTVQRGAFADRKVGGFIYVIHGSVVERRAVQLGVIGEDKVEILGGVAAGERVVVSGSDAFDGAPRVILRR